MGATRALYREGWEPLQGNPPNPCTDRHDWKYYPLAASLLGGKNEKNQVNFTKNKFLWKDITGKNKIATTNLEPNLHLWWRCLPQETLLGGHWRARVPTDWSSEHRASGQSGYLRPRQARRCCFRQWNSWTLVCSHWLDLQLSRKSHNIWMSKSNDMTEKVISQPYVQAFPVSDGSSPSLPLSRFFSFSCNAGSANARHPFSKSANIRIESVSYYMLVTAVFLRMNLQENWVTSGLQNLVYCSVLSSWLYWNSHYWISWVVTHSDSKVENTQSGSGSVKMNLRLDALCPWCRLEMDPPPPIHSQAAGGSSTCIPMGPCRCRCRSVCS